MTNLDGFTDLDSLDALDKVPGPALAADRSPEILALSKRERAAIILGVLGTEAATPILEQMDEGCHRAFASAMARLEKIKPETVETVIQDFVAELETSEMTVSGGLDRAREMLVGVTDANVLADILDEADHPTSRNVWEKLEKVEDVVLAEMLELEHPQTAAVIVDRLPAEKAAIIMDLVSIDTACRIVLGMNRASMLSPRVIDAIGQSVSKDFLAHQKRGKRITPADKIGAIMNYAPGEVRTNVLNFLGRTDPDLLTEVKKKMFTFDDIPARIENRDITAIVRATPNETLLTALAGAQESAPAVVDYVLGNISSRVAEQLREELGDMGKVKVRVSEEAQTEIIKIIRTLESEGALKLAEQEE